jgi:YVTN family beta-propeller protein
MNDDLETRLRRYGETFERYVDAQVSAFSSAPADPAARRRSVGRSAIVAAIAACLVVALVVGVALLLSARDDRSSVQLAAGASGGCAGKAYVDNGVDGTVSVITTATGEVSTPIRVSESNSATLVAITPDGKRAYVSHDNAVSVIDTATDTVSATIPVGKNPGRGAITPDGKHVYVTTGGDTVSVIDTATGVVSATIPVGPAGYGGITVAITPDGKHAYVSHDSTVSVIDTATDTVSATIPVDSGTVAVAITPDGKHAYVTIIGFRDITQQPSPAPVHGMVSVIDTATGVVSATIPVGAFPYGVAITPDGTHAYVADHDGVVGGGGRVSVIDTATGVVSGVITLGTDNPQGVAITPDGRYAYVTGTNEYSHLPGKEDPAIDPLPIHGSVFVIDTATGVVSATIPVGKSPVGVAICPP